MPAYLVTDVVSIYKMQRTEGEESFASDPVYTNINACISPPSNKLAWDIKLSEGVPSFQLFEIYIWDITVTLSIGDKIIAQDGTEYRLLGVPNVYKNRYVQALFCMAGIVV